MLFEFNGTFAWLAHSAINPIAFLPMSLYGIETLRSAVHTGRSGGWSWLAAGLALSLYAGFPETAYLDGLLVLGWAVFRVVTADARMRLALRRA